MWEIFMKLELALWRIMVPLYIYVSLMVIFCVLLILFADVFKKQLPLIFQNSAGLHHLTGLVHVSEVSWDLVQDVRDILSEGDKVRVKVINVDRQVLSDSFLLPADLLIPGKICYFNFFLSVIQNTLDNFFVEVFYFLLLTLPICYQLFFS